ncbi:LysR family transcriptional regulator [Comamonas flocculans]|uniref:LysR family transcriptional regulator n=1 Tax=Comamonas flocculans TaxID=2597701 RepID=A0A5B8RW97_9BURK|nr:LysR family transcriptional regulator [Comamonas flocculans]QEA13770.1 LysR family transcriptional regulator [Comamonas flocculans]
MDSLDLIQIFREVARRGSFSATAAAQGVSPASVSKAVARLEERFGLRLFNRTTRKVSLTDAGQLLFERSSALLELIDLTTGELHERATRPSGRLALALPYGLVDSDLPAMLGDFLQRHPDVELDMHVTDRVIDLADEGVDLAFRVGPIRDAALIVRRLLPLDYVAAATPAYWSRHGRPREPRDLLTHAQLGHGPNGRVVHWMFEVNGAPLELNLQPRVHASLQSALIPLALQGLGVMWAPRRSLARWLDSGELEGLLADFSPSNVWLHAAYMQRRHNSAALRALLAHLDAFVRAFQQGEGMAPAPQAAAAGAPAPDAAGPQRRGRRSGTTST